MYMYAVYMYAVHVHREYAYFSRIYLYIKILDSTAVDIFRVFICTYGCT